MKPIAILISVCRFPRPHSDLSPWATRWKAELILPYPPHAVVMDPYPEGCVGYCNDPGSGPYTLELACIAGALADDPNVRLPLYRVRSSKVVYERLEDYCKRERVELRVYPVSTIF